jgi:Carboxypeptidase regulatory-like domain/TonB dependent receptor/TonB-dependent Receptor Plug Domain
MKYLQPAFALLLVISIAPAVFAQDFRAVVNGKVTDPDKAVVPGAVVTVTNHGTNEAVRVTTDAEGNYTVPFLNPGSYSITVEAKGFKKYSRTKQELQVSQTATINIELELGGANEVVNITAEQPLLEEGNADRGTVIDNSIITELPLNARNPFMLAALTPGVTFDGDNIYQRPFDNGAVGTFSFNGTPSRNNEFSLDGAPNNALVGGNNIGMVPPVDAVKEFKIVTNAYDAQYGRTAGGVVNVSLKSGENAYHGSIYEFARRNFMDSNYLVSNYRGIPAGQFQNPDGTFSDAPHLLDQYGFSVNGPVWIPKLYNGRNKTFFLFSFEDYNEQSPNPEVRTVPTEEFLRGDFRNLTDANGIQIPIYNPFTTQQVGTQWVRNQFENNIIPDHMIHPLARKLMLYFPKPNQTSRSGEPWRNNFSDIPNMARDDFTNWAFKIDQRISENDKIYFRYGHNKRTEMRWTNGITEGPAQNGQLPLIRINHSGVVDWVHTFNSSLVLNLRASANRFVEDASTGAGLNFSLSELGFPQSMADQVPVKIFPKIEFGSGYIQLGRGQFVVQPTNVAAFQPNVIWMRGNLTIRSGLDMRYTQYGNNNSGDIISFSFNRNFTKRIYNDNNDPTGHTIASFLLGAIAGGSITNNAAPIYMWKYYAPWAQFDWKATPRLTVNFGARWDFNSPVQERFDRRSYIFDPSQDNPVSQRINATTFPTYTQLKGGLRFLNVDGSPSTAWRFDTNNIQPRIGFAYKLTEKTVLRGGIGRFYLNPTPQGHGAGFSITTPLVSSLDGGRRPHADFNQYFPNGVLIPPGTGRGLETNLGQNISYANPNFEIPYTHNFSFGFQRQLGWMTVLEMSYVGTRAYKLPSSYGGINEPGAEVRRLCDVTRGGNRNFCDQDIANPFRNVPGFEGTGFFTGTTRDRYLLMRPYPQFNRITETERNEGKSWYNSLQVVANRRLSKGLSVNASYTFSKAMERVPGTVTEDYRLNRLESRGIASEDRPHRITFAGIFFLPVGRGQRFFRGMPRVLDAVFGGWEMAGAIIRESGRPWDLPNPEDNLPIAYLGGGELSKSEREGMVRGDEYIFGFRPCVERRENNQNSQNFGKYILTPSSINYGCTSANFRVVEAYETYDAPLRDARFRRPTFTQIDVNFAKNWRIREKHKLQLRIEAFNLFNTPMFNRINYNRDVNSAQFGAINKSTQRQNNFPRQFQLAVKYNF